MTVLARLNVVELGFEEGIEFQGSVAVGNRFRGSACVVFSGD